MQQVSQELSTGEIIRRGFSLFRAQFLSIVTPLFFGAIIAALMRLLFAYQTAPLTQQLATFRNATINETNAGQILSIASQLLSYSVLEAVVLFVISVPFFAVALKIAYDSSSGKASSLTEGFSTGFNRTPSLIAAGIIIGTLVVLGLVLLVVPGILFTIMFIMFIPAITLENESSLGSLRRSRQLVSHRWGVVFIVALIAFIVSVGIGTVFGNLFNYLDIYTSSLVQPFYGLISDVLGVSLLTVLYQSLLVREVNTSSAQTQATTLPTTHEIHH
jgi:hypothetical protein